VRGCLAGSRNAHVLTRPPPVRQDAPITSQKALVERARSEGWQGSSRTILRVRRVPMMKPWLLDARSEGKSDYLLFGRRGESTPLPTVQWHSPGHIPRWWI